MSSSSEQSMIAGTIMAGKGSADSKEGAKASEKVAREGAARVSYSSLLLPNEILIPDI